MFGNLFRFIDWLKMYSIDGFNINKIGGFVKNLGRNFDKVNCFWFDFFSLFICESILFVVDGWKWNFLFVLLLFEEVFFFVSLVGLINLLIFKLLCNLVGVVGNCLFILIEVFL